MRTVVPTFIKYQSKGNVNLAYDVMNLFQHWVLVMCQFRMSSVQVTIMPPFTPNEHMLNKFRTSEEQEDWQIYAECVRDLISKHSGLPKAERIDHKEKIMY